MNFANPWLLAAGLACLAIPVLVHLQRRRQPRRIVFSTLRLMEASLRTSRRKRRITDWPLFLLRCLAVLFVAFVFSKFFIAGLADGPRPQREAIALVLDRSASMNAQGSVGTVQQEAVEAALRAIDATGAASQIGVILSPGLQEEAVIRWTRPADARQTLRAVESSRQAGDLSAAIEKAAASLERFGPDYPKIVHVISDLQLSALDGIDQLVLPPNVSIRVTKVGDLNPVNGGLRAGVRGRDVLRSGLYAWSAGTGEPVTVTDHAYGREGRQAVVREQSLPLPDAPGALSVPYTAGERFGWFARTIALSGNDAWADDDLAYDAFYIQQPLPVVLIEPKPSAETFLQATFFVSRALSPENYREEVAMQFRLQPTTVADAAAALQSLTQSSGGRALVVLPDLGGLARDAAGALVSLVESGGGLILFGGPSGGAGRNALQRLSPVTIQGEEAVTLSPSLAAVSPQHPLWGGLDSALRRRIRRLPLTHRHQVTPKGDATTLASFADQVPLIVERAHGKGNVIFVNATADRQWGQWQTDGMLFVVTMHLLAARAVEQEEDRWRNATTQAVAGADMTLKLGEEFRSRAIEFDQDTHTANENGEIHLSLPSTPGFYPLKDEAGRLTRLLAVNLPPEESNLQSLQGVVVQRQLENRRVTPEEGDPSFLKENTNSQGSLLWRSTLILLALLLAGETLISNRFSGAKAHKKS